MQFGNTGNSFGFVTRVLHWTTALVILSAFALGILANRQELTTDVEIRQAFLLFSAHKTTGVFAFALGIFRLFWTFSQPRPAPIHIERHLENTVATTVHWMLTIALITVPMAGWLSHSATSDLAPIWWPFVQSLPFVPIDDALAERFAAIHRLFTKLLLAAVVLHIAGALKHALIDKDEVLARMWRGLASGALEQKSQSLPALVALLIWAIALSAGLLVDKKHPVQAVAAPTEWPLADAEVIFVDGNGSLLGTATTFGFILVINADSQNVEKGTLDLTVPLDTLELPANSNFASDIVFPLLQFFGTVQGTPPTLSASGPLVVGELVEQADFSVVVQQSGARITGTTVVPGPKNAFVSVDAFARRP